MNSDTPPPKIQDLQKDVIELLEQISALMDSASTQLWSKDGTENKYKKYREQIANEARKVENLELRMAITAPMKAGKSTIINAIVGQELLPSRNAAMTTLPTEIVFNTELKEPVLKLSATIVSSFQETWLVLKGKIEESGIDRIQERIAQYPHLIELLEEIQDKVGFPIRAKTYGRDEILKTLASLNDIIRLCSKIAPLADPLRSLTDVPRIETPLWRSQATAQPQILGNLVIVDTPGPNEAGENLRLAAVVEEQLQKSSLVLIVLDYTQLKTKAAEDVKEEVEKVIQIRGKENLYVLVNKIDQRTDSDMTREQVRQFVAAEFGVGDSGNTDRVFEISARRAFYATNFQLELQQQPEISIAQMQTARALAQQAYGDMWEILCQNANVNQMQLASQQVWNRSGFAPFLDQAINALMAEAAPRCIRDALNIARVRLVELRNDIKLQRGTLGAKADELHAEIRALENNLSALEECRGDFLQQEVDKLKENLRCELNAELKVLQKQAEVSIDTFFIAEEEQRSEEEYQRANTIGKVAHIVAVGSRKISDFLQDKKYRNARVIEFETEEEAKELIDLARAYARERVDSLIDSVRKPTEDKVKQTSKQLIAQLNSKTRPIIEGARQRLNKTFNIDLEELPLLFLNEERDIITEDFQFTFERNVRVKIEYQNLKVRVKIPILWWMWDWGEIEIPFPVPVKTKEEYYTVSLAELVSGVNKSIEESIENIDQKINEYLDKDFQQRVDTLFQRLNTHLSGDKDILVKSLKNKNLSLNQQEELKLKLKNLEKVATQIIDNVDVYMGRTNELITVRQ